MGQIEPGLDKVISNVGILRYIMPLLSFFSCFLLLSLHFLLFIPQDTLTCFKNIRFLVQ